MRLYSGSSKEFVTDTTQNQIADKLTKAYFKYFGFNPSNGEIKSWENSLARVALMVDQGRFYDNGIILEYQLPLSSKRLDFLISGKDESNKDNVVIIELKQWDETKPCDLEREVLTWVGGREREVLHPSVQVQGYKNFLQDAHTAFYGDNAINLNAVAYLHNYSFESSDAIYDIKFQKYLEECPTFTKDEVPTLTQYIKDRVGKGGGMEILAKVEESKYRPNKELMKHVAQIIKNKKEYILLDEQQVIYDKVFATANSYHIDNKKKAIIVKGGPGTGKSVIALNLMANLMLNDKNTQYVTGSRAFTETLREIIGPEARTMINYFNSFVKADRDSIDVIIADEAHRLRINSNNRFVKKENQPNIPQVEELFNAGKVCVFFIDDKQVVRPNEIGSVDYIKEMAEKNGVIVYEYELDIQFRCGGSNAFVNWVNNTLDIQRTANVLWNTDEESFEFKITDTPEELEDMIREKVDKGHSARITAGFTWQWTYPNSEGELPDDIIIGDYRRPWDARPDAGKLKKGIPTASLWAYDPNGINQIGCVYTAQGFEFEYIGVIFGKDLVYRFEKLGWVGQSEHSFDVVVKRSKDKFIDMVKNTYRILLTRGLKGCYVTFLDEETKMFFKSRLGRAID